MADALQNTINQWSNIFTLEIREDAKFFLLVRTGHLISVTTGSIQRDRLAYDISQSPVLPNLK